jgi:hypothetical protein
MHIMQFSPRFPDQRFISRGCKRPWQSGIYSRRGTAGNHDGPAAEVLPRNL